MADPLSIAGIALTVVQVLRPVVTSLTEAYVNRGSVYQTLDELKADLVAVCVLVDNIYLLFSYPSFTESIREVQRESRVNLLESLERALRSCSRDVQSLSDILFDFGTANSSGRFKQSILQFRIDRRLDDISRIKRNFQDHKSSLQVELQLVTTCKQMQMADRDALNAAELKAQLDGLQNAMQQMSRQISERQVVPGDEEQTKLLSDMQDIHNTSATIERRATLQLKYLTSLVEETKTTAQEGKKAPPPVPPRKKIVVEHVLPALGEDEGSETVTPGSPGGYQALSPQVSPHPSSKRSKDLGNYPNSPWSTPEKPLALPIAGLPTPPLSATASPEVTVTTSTTFSAEKFDEEMHSLLQRASTQRMGIDKPFSDDVIMRVGAMLSSMGKHSWSERPRTYLVLRLINEVRAMENFVFEGFKDIDFPYSERTIPDCIKSTSSRHDFLKKQKYILSARSVDLVQGGRHHHLDKSADSYFIVGESLGSGGFSIVDRVRSRLTLQDYARKRIDRSGTFAKDRKKLAFFENEVHNLKRLSHHHLVKFVGSYTDRKYIGIIMEPVADFDLRRYLAKEAWTTEELATLRTFVGCLCSALAYLHENKCRHKDLKPHNILIKDSTVYIADFGIAFDWTESQRETTVGRPEAYTEAYVAPEVGRQQPRNSASDIWSLGCIFLEIATILSGRSLEMKNDFFQSSGTRSAVYWQNQEAIGLWTSVLHSVSESDARLFEWVASMTSLDGKIRPTARDMEALIAQSRSKDIRYSGSCCVEDYESDSTSWNGSASGDELFETDKIEDGVFVTARPTMPVLNATKNNYQAYCETYQPDENGEGNLGRPYEHAHSSQSAVEKQILNDATTASTSSDKTLQPQATEDRRAPTPPPIKLAQPSPSPKEPPEKRSTWLGSGVNQTTLFCATPAAMTVAAEPPLSHPGTTKNKAVPDEGLKLPGAAKAATDSANLLPRNRTSRRTETEHDAANLRYVHIPQAAAKEPEEALHDETTLADVFNDSRGRFEDVLVERRDQGKDWRPELSALIRNNSSDKKGYNMLVVASDFVDDALARDVVEVVLHEKPELAGHLTVFKNSALHYAAMRDRANLVKYLIKKGADPGVANIRGQTALHIAARQQNVNAVKMLLRYLSADQVIAKDDFGQTPLHLACCCNTPVELIENLLNAGAQTNLADHSGNTPIQLNASLGNPDALDVLLAHHTEDEPDVEPPPPYQSTISLQQSPQPAVPGCKCEVCLLIRAVGDISEHNPAVYVCLCSYHILVLCQDTLSDAEAVLSMFNDCSCPLCVGGRELNASREPCVTLPVCECSACEEARNNSTTPSMFPFTDPPTIPHPQDFMGSPLPPYPGHEYYDYIIEECLMASDAGLSQQEITTLALDALAEGGFKGKNSYRNNPEKALAWVINNYASLNFVHKIVEILLDCGARVDTVDKSGCTCLHVASRAEEDALIKLLLDRGATLDFPRQAAFAQKAQYTPLRYALFFDRPLALRQLLRAGANVNDQSVYGNATLLHEAVTHFDILGWHIPLLLAHGAWTESQDDEFNTPLHIAVLNGQAFAAMALLDAGANIEAIGKGGAKPLGMALENGNSIMIHLLLQRGADVHARCNGMPCALFAAIHKEYSWIIQTLLEDYDADEDIHRTDLMGRGVLHILANTSIDNIMETIGKLVEWGANVDAEDHSGSTPLHEAAKVGSSVMVGELLDHGATQNAQNRQGKTPLDLAQSKKHREVVEYLGGTLKKKSWFRRS